MSRPLPDGLGLGSLLLPSHEKAKEWGGEQRVLGLPGLSLGREMGSGCAEAEGRDLGRGKW